MKTKLILTTTFACFLAVSAQAETQSFDFKDPKGVNNATFKLDAPLEAITGTANGISGTVSYDAEKPESLTGKIVVETKSLTIPNPVMTDHMRGADWLDAAKFPEITFEAGKVANVKRDGDNTTADVTGKFTMHGATNVITVPVKLTYLKGKLAVRSNGQVQGDLLVLRAKFTVKRTDYGINQKAPTDKVADEIELALSLAGASPKK